MISEEKQRRLKIAEDTPRIYAKDGEIGKEYLVAGMLYKVKILNITGIEFGCTSVTVESENFPGGTVNIAGGTELIPFVGNENLHIPTKTPTETKKAKASGDTASKTSSKPSKETGGIKMSDIINPLLLKGVDAEKIADAVIKEIPEKASKRKALVNQIKGPRRHNLIKALKNKGKEIPEHLLQKSH